MTTITFDKLSFIDRLKSGGVSDDEARIHADALDSALKDAVATRADVASLKSEMSELKVEMSELKVEIANVKADILKTFIPLMLGQIAVTVALIKLL